MLPLIAAKLASPLGRVAAVGIVAGIAGFSLAWKLQSANINALKLSYADAHQKALIQALDDQAKVNEATLRAAVADAANQVRIVTETQVITKWAIKNVEVIANCPDRNFVRLHNAAAVGADPASETGSASEPHAGATATTAPAH